MRIRIVVTEDRCRTSEAWPHCKVVVVDSKQLLRFN